MITPLIGNYFVRMKKKKKENANKYKDFERSDVMHLIMKQIELLLNEHNSSLFFLLNMNIKKNKQNLPAVITQL